MKKLNAERFFDELIPKRGEYLNSKQLVIESQKQNTPISRKTIHNYIKDKLLPKPVHVSKEALFHREFILGEIKAIHILKSIFHVEYKDLKILASNRFVSLREIVSSTHSILDDLRENNIGKAKERPLLVSMANEEFLQGVVALFLAEIKKGKDPRKMDIGKFVGNAFDKIKG